MSKQVTLLIILLMFSITQLLGTFFQLTIFEIEKRDNPHFTKQTSESLSPYRGSNIPLFLLPIAFVIMLNVYLFLFRFSLILKLAKAYIYIFSIICFAITTQIIGAYILTPYLQNINLILSLLVPSFLLVLGKLKNIVNNILGISLCGITGSFLASFFTVNSMLALLGIISFLDYYFVIREKKIPRIVETLSDYEIPLAISYSSKSIEYQLGYGDLIFATGITVAFFIDIDLLSAIRTIAFTTLFLMLYIISLSKKEGGKPYPAIPAIFAGGVVSAIFGVLLL
jgi:uncharacterized protein YneF (UPF0154 family)